MIHRLSTLLALTALLLPASFAAAKSIAVGDTIEQVDALLGEPRGMIRAGEFEMRQYDRGRIEIEDGIVTRVELVSDEAAVAKRLQQKEVLARLEAEQESRAEQLQLEGLAIRQRTRESMTFQQTSASHQLQYWTRFQHRYPDVAVDEEINESLAKRQLELERREAALEREHLTQQLAAMERRISDAEARAEEAEQQAERQREQRYVSRYTYTVLPASCPSPVVVPAYHHKPIPRVASVAVPHRHTTYRNSPGRSVLWGRHTSGTASTAKTYPTTTCATAIDQSLAYQTGSHISWRLNF